MWRHVTGEVDKSVGLGYSCQIFSGFNIIYYWNRSIFDRVIQKIIGWTFFGGTQVSSATLGGFDRWMRGRLTCDTNCTEVTQQEQNCHQNAFSPLSADVLNFWHVRYTNTVLLSESWVVPFRVNEQQLPPSELLGIKQKLPQRSEAWCSTMQRDWAT